MPSALLHGGNVWVHQLQIFWISGICTRAGFALAACKWHRHKHTGAHMLPGSFSHSLCPVKFPWFCLQWVLIEQVVSERGKLGRDPDESGSGSQTVREQGVFGLLLPSVGVSYRNSCVCCCGVNGGKRKYTIYEWWKKCLRSFSFQDTIMWNRSQLSTERDILIHHLTFI